MTEFLLQGKQILSEICQERPMLYSLLLQHRLFETRGRKCSSKRSLSNMFKEQGVCLVEYITVFFYLATRVKH